MPLEDNEATGSPLSPAAQEEIGFWAQELAKVGKHTESVRCRLDQASRLEAFPLLLLHQVIPMLRARFGPEPVRCVEIGPGPLSTLAYGVDEGLLEVTAVDVLAAEYHDLLSRTGHGDYPVRPITGRAEDLANMFPEGSFHLAFVRNALDHTDDIAQSFDSLVRVLLPGGAIVMEHHLREGTRQNWSDSHNWNLDIEGSSLVATGRAGQRHVLSQRDDLELVYLHYRSELLDGWIEHVFRKL